jgi:hypothetical protein
MKAKLILTISILAVLLSACSSSLKENGYAKELLKQKLTLPNGKTGTLVVSLAKEDSAYLITFETKDEASRLKYVQLTNFYTQYSRSTQDSILGAIDEMSTGNDRHFRVVEPSGGPSRPIRHHTTIDVLARTYLDTLKFQDIAKIEFFPENYSHPTKIEKIIIWEAKQVVKY